METRRLHYFSTVVDCGTITRAAETLYIAQPALSQHIVSLEREFGQKLLIRSRRGVQPTEAGSALYRYAQGILRLERAARDDILHGQSAPSGLVTVGVAPYTHFSAVMAPIVKKIRSRYPEITVRTIETLTKIHSQALQLGQIDVGLIFDPGNMQGVDSAHIATEELYLVTPQDVELSGATDTTVPMSSIPELEYILPRAEHTLRRRVESALFDMGAQLKVSAEVEETYPLLRSIDAGLGATILPRSAVDALFGDDGDNISARLITDPTLKLNLALVTARDQPFSPAVEAVISELHDFFVPGEDW